MKHCCEMMESNVNNTCEMHSDRYDCPDMLLDYIPKFDESGIIVHDGGSSKISIYYCPWCGAKLPESKRDKWFETIESLGFECGDDNIPEKYKSDAWYRSEQCE